MAETSSQTSTIKTLLGKPASPVLTAPVNSKSLTDSVGVCKYVVKAQKPTTVATPIHVQKKDANKCRNNRLLSTVKAPRNRRVVTVVDSNPATSESGGTTARSRVLVKVADTTSGVNRESSPLKVVIV